MFEKDYIIRLLNQFFEDLNAFLHKKKAVNKQEDWQNIYNAYTGDYTFYHTAGMDEILKSFDTYEGEERTYRMQILAELYLQETRTVLLSPEDKKALLEKSLLIWEYIDRNSDTYSIERKQRIDSINDRLQEYRKS